MSTAKTLRAGLLAGLACWSCLGCAHPHYVVKNPDGGVIAIEEDTPELRAKAEKLMSAHLPQGYVIEDVREVAVGAPYQTMTQVGPFVEVKERQDHEVMLTYHVPRPAGVAPARYDQPRVQLARPAVAAAPSPVEAAGLPAQPIPVGE